MTGVQTCALPISDAAVDVVRDYVRRELAELSSVPADDLVEQRRARFEAF